MSCILPANPPLVRGACALLVWSDGCIDGNSHWPQACLSIYDEHNDSKVLIDFLGVWMNDRRRWFMGSFFQGSSKVGLSANERVRVEQRQRRRRSGAESTRGRLVVTSFWPLTSVSRDFCTTHVDTISQQSCVPRAVLLHAAMRLSPLAVRPCMSSSPAVRGSGAYIRYLHHAVHMPPPAIAAELLNA